MKLLRKKSATSQILEVFIQDTRLGDGGGLTGLLFNTASLTCYYHRNSAGAAVAVTLVTMTVGTFTASGFKEIDATNMPGWYQLCLPNAAYASGADSLIIHLKGAANMGHVPLEIQLTDLDVNATMAFAVWDEATTGHAIAGTFGEQVKTDIDSILVNLGTVDDFLDTEIGAIKAVTDLLPNGGALSTIQSDLDDLQTHIGLAGTGLIAIPWNSAWDVEVQSEVADALASYDPPTHTELIAEIDAVQADVATRASQTSLNTVDDFLDTEIAAIKTVTDAIGATGTGLSAIPWNAAWDTEVQSEVADALNAYDPPTQAELVSEINAVQADIATLNNLSAAQVNAEVDAALADAQLDEFVDMIELDGGLYRFTVASLANSPAGGGGGATAADVWTYVTRTLTSGANIALAKGTGVTGFNDLSAAQVNTEVDTALVDYDAPTAAELVTEIDSVQSDIFSVAARLPAALTAGGHMKSDMLALNGSLTSALLLALSAGTLVTGASIAGTLSTTQMTTNLTEVTDDHYKSRLIAWLSPSALFGQYSVITSYDGTTKRLTYVAITEAPAAGDTFIII